MKLIVWPRDPIFSFSLKKEFLSFKYKHFELEYGPLHTQAAAKCFQESCAHTPHRCQPARLINHLTDNSAEGPARVLVWTFPNGMIHVLSALPIVSGATQWVGLKMISKQTWCIILGLVPWLLSLSPQSVVTGWKISTSGARVVAFLPFRHFSPINKLCFRIFHPSCEPDK